MESERQLVSNIAHGLVSFSSIKDQVFLSKFGAERAMFARILNNEEIDHFYAAAASIMIKQDLFDENDAIRAPRTTAELQRYSFAIFKKVAENKTIPIEKLLKLLGMGNMTSMIKDHETLVRCLEASSQFVG